jgi:hypothetical protein
VNYAEVAPLAASDGADGSDAADGNASGMLGGKGFTVATAAMRGDRLHGWKKVQNRCATGSSAGKVLIGSEGECPARASLCRERTWMSIGKNWSESRWCGTGREARPTAVWLVGILGTQISTVEHETPVRVDMVDVLDHPQVMRYLIGWVGDSGDGNRSVARRDGEAGRDAACEAQVDLTQE